MAEVIVVGGGVGGMVSALLLAERGYRVRLYERLPRLGGKLAEHHRDGFTFSLGPSLLTLPRLFTELGLDLDLVELAELCRYRFADGSELTAYRDPAATAAEVDRLSPGEGRNWLAFHDWARTCFEASRRTFFSGPLTAPRADTRLSDLLAVAPGRTLDGLARRFFTDPRLRQYVGRYATYAGSSPYRAPAALGCVPAIEHGEGGWYVPGGLPRIADALALALEKAGVEVRLNADVAEVLADGERVRGVRLASGERERADVVIANTDAAALYGTLLPDRRRLRRIARLGTSSSVLLLLAGVEGRSARPAHHSIVFSADYGREFADIFERRRPPEDPTVYIGCSAVDDPSQAPPGMENQVMLVNVPARDPARWPMPPEAYRDLVLERLASRGHDLSGRLRFVDLFTPADLRDRYGAWGGSIYGGAYSGPLAPFRRPGNRGPRRGLYLVGGSAHPGGGLPLVAMGGRIVASLVREDFPTGRAGRTGAGRPAPDVTPPAGRGGTETPGTSERLGTPGTSGAPGMPRVTGGDR
ncbi:phytoene desaturase [Streptosporangium becharense]|uniref:4,4'-diaponeurosporene oxygenase n=1 Tax=Streptosporangium becharense TaxID=1816182 RepID=A0A7W9IMG3_9ACTN|nr:phytoene desaturase family protein [Streptosporangium becharense]MBB2914598.1 phytoene desaturase [Streptosporangium becharense]MBB5823443.1 phytoene desaturase [Streptosporangium becharense]